MSLLIIFLSIALLILLISWGRLNAFIAFLLVSLLAGWLLGIPVADLTKSLKKGIGDMLGELIIIISLGAMLGKLVAESGAAQKISDVLLKTFGQKHIQWAMMLTGFIVGIPLFYNVGFVLLVPLLFSVVYRTGLPAVWVGIPMLAALSVTHGFLPPHPAPAALVAQFGANLGVTLLYGIFIAVPTIILAGPVFANTLKNIHSTPLQTFRVEPIPADRLPGAANSFLSALLPVILLLISTAIPMMGQTEGMLRSTFAFLGDSIIVMLISLLVATFSLGIANGKSMKTITGYYGEAVKDVSLVLLIVAGAGALKQVLIDSGVSNEIGAMLQGLAVNPLVLGWLIAAMIRLCVGSATVAGLTAAGIMAPVLVQSGADPNLMVLSIGAGSLVFSHVNDSGFWMYKEYFNLSIKDTFRSWTVMESIVAVAGLAGVLVLDVVV